MIVDNYNDIPIDDMPRKRKKHIKGILVAMLLTFATGLLVYTLLYVKKLNEYFVQGDTGAKLAITPNSGKFGVGGQYTVYVVLSTDQSDTNAIDVKLKFDPSIIKIIDSDTSQPGIQVEPNFEAFKTYLVNSVNNSTGEITITALSYDKSENRPTVSFRGKQNIAGIKFEALKSINSTPLNFIFEKGLSTDSNVADSKTNKDILSSVENANYEITSANLVVTAYGTSTNGISPKLTLSIKDGDVEKKYQTIDIATAPANQTNYKDHVFDMSQGLKNGDVIYLDFENDTRDGLDNRPGGQDRNITIQKITFGDRIFYFNTSNSTEDALAKKDKDEKRVYYDRADKEGGALYDNGKFGKFGTARDAKTALEKGTRENGLLLYNDPLGWGPNFKGEVYWNGAIVINVDFLGSGTPIPTPSTPTPVPSVTAPPVPANRASDITSPSNPTLTSTSATFVWTSGENISSYDLRIGTSGTNSNNVSSTNYGGSTRQVIINNLPDNGSDLYVRLVSNFQNGQNAVRDYKYKAYTKPIPTPTPTQPQNEVVVRAKGTPAFNFGPTMKVYVNGNLIATENNLTNLDYRDFIYRPTTNIAIDSVDIEFPNDAWQNAQNDRNLYVDYIKVNGVTIQSEDSTKVKYDKNSGFDNIDVVNGQEAMLFSGALRYRLSGVVTPPPTIQKTKITIRARGQKAFNIGPNMKAYVNSTLFNSVNEVANTSYADYSFDVLDKSENISNITIVFDNDAWQSETADRNLYIDYIKIDDAVYQAEDTSKVTFDRNLPFDNIDVIPGREDLLWNGGLKFNIRTTTSTNPTVGCIPTGEAYTALNLNSKNDRPAALHADLNLALRGYVQIINDSNLKRLVDLSGSTDLQAPKIYTMFDVGKQSPAITSVYNIYDWNWAAPPQPGTKGNRITFPEVTMIGLSTTRNDLIRVPDSGYSVSSQGHEAYVLYASENRITLNYTSDDTVSTGYTIQLEKLCVDQNLLNLYKSLNENNPTVRAKLPAVFAKQPIGRALGDEVLVVVRDRGSFMDPRSRKDWWQ